MLSCKAATKLIPESLDGSLPVSRSLALQLHLLACPWCSRYREQVLFIHDAGPRLTENEKADLLGYEWPGARLEQNADQAHELLARLPSVGVDLERVTRQLEHEGVEAFAQPFDSLMTKLQKHMKAFDGKRNEAEMVEAKCDIGMVGLGVMGRNLLLNMADHGYSAAGYDTDPNKADALLSEAENQNVQAAIDLKQFIDLLRSPKAVMMLVPAGPPVDSVIGSLLPHLSAGDVIIDGGNSHFRDTQRRVEELSKKAITYLGVGISGGEHGARHGPSIMPGGDPDGYERVRPIFEAIAARVNTDPCVAYLGPGATGHYVKMVHNGIEYGLMQLIAETYDIMKRGMLLSNEKIQTIYREWNRQELNSYLLEISANIFGKLDGKTGKHLIDVILDEAAQKGTGMWTSESALELQSPAPVIDMAVAMRDLSALKSERIAANKMLGCPSGNLENRPEKLLDPLKNALYVAMIVTYAQGMALLRTASEAYGFGLNPAEVAKIWRGGCIIRATLLDKIRQACTDNPVLPNLLLDPRLAQEVRKREADLRSIICNTSRVGLPAPGLMASLSYLDSYRSSRLPANLIQAQRDYFGAHTYQRVDAEGSFHTQWSQS